MYIGKLSLINFKNYAEAEISLHPRLNCFVGNNGQGKTNLLDAVYYLCMCKSYFNSSDLYSIRDNEEFMTLQAVFSREGKEEELHCGLVRNKKKQFRRNRKEYDRLSDHIGLFPVVMVSPADIQMILDGSEERRRYINSVISQYDKQYLENSISYNKVLAQRNHLLKSMKDNPGSAELLDIYDGQLIPLGTQIYEQRKSFIDRFTPVFNRYYSFISDNSETVDLNYQSDLNDGDFKEILTQARKRDTMVQYTTVGPHKDDLVLNLNGIPIRKIGSQGQQKTYLVSLKLAQFDFMKAVRNLQPILLLDDIFDKFDASRVRQILKLVSDESYGQIFITHTNLDRMKNILTELGIEHKLFEVTRGRVDEVPE